jgi:hypothetical protein
MDYAEFGFSFGAESGPMQSLVDMVRQLVVRMNTCNQGSQVRLGIALEEALQFMQWRGSFEFSPEQFQQVAMKTEAGQRLLTERQTQAPWNIRKLQVTCRVDTQEVNVTIRHDGPPFAMPQMPMLDDAPELELASNRSVVLFSSLLQKVVFNSENRSLHLLYRK